MNHLCPEISVHLVAAVPNGLTVEYMPWSGKLFREVPQPVNGEQSVTFSAPPGTYAFYCAIPGHESIGMRGTLTVH